MALPLRTAIWNYDRTLPLIDGSVRVEGCALSIEVLRPEAIFARAFLKAEFDVSELSFSNSITAFSKGEFPYVLIPIFLARAFRHSAIVVRGDRGIVQPRDLRGKVVGLQEYAMTAAVVVRGFLRDYGVDPSSIGWRMGEKGLFKELEFPAGGPPAGLDIRMLSGEFSLEERLLSGELDAAILTRKPASMDVPGSKIVRLFPDPKAAEAEWYKAKKIFPIMHVVGVRKTLLKDDPTLARRIYDAFQTAKDIAVSELETTQAPKVTLPWAPFAVDEARSLMGLDYWPYGIARNRHVLEAQINWSALDGLQARAVVLDELFARDCLDT